MDYKKRLSTKPPPKEIVYRRVGKYVFPENFIKDNGYNIEDFPICAMTEFDLKQSLERIKQLERMKL